MSAATVAADEDLVPPDALAAFFAARGMSHVREASIPATLLPAPYRQLLDHDQDMTSTLEQFHSEAITLEVLAKTSYPGRLLREVILRGEVSGRPFELGAIDIYLHRYPPAARSEIEIGRRPLGALLSRHGIRYLSRPAGFLRVAASSALQQRFGLPGNTPWLYGRHNLLIDPAGHTLAEVVEILPPAVVA